MRYRHGNVAPSATTGVVLEEKLPFPLPLAVEDRPAGRRKSFNLSRADREVERLFRPAA